MPPQPPASFDHADDPKDLDDALTETRDALMAFDPTKPLAPPFDKLLVQLDGFQPIRRSLQRALSALLKQKQPLDDQLNEVLDIVRGTLEPRVKKTKDHEPEPWVVQAWSDCFGSEKPADARKHTLGPQVEIQRFWETKLANAPVPELVKAGKDNSAIIVRADKLAEAITIAEAALDQFLLGPWADFVASCNAALQLVFGQLGDFAKAPPPGVKIPPGFIDRFFLREPAPRPMTAAELAKSIERAEVRLAKQKKLLEEKLAKQKSDKRDKLLKEAAEAQAKADAVKKESADAAARLAEIQAELAKLDQGE